MVGVLLTRRQQLNNHFIALWGEIWILKFSLSPPLLLDVLSQDNDGPLIFSVGVSILPLFMTMADYILELFCGIFVFTFINWFFTSYLSLVFVYVSKAFDNIAVSTLLWKQ